MKTFKDKKILIAGGTGVIGTQIANMLIKYSKDIFVVANDKKIKIKKRLSPLINYTELDLRNYKNCKIATNKMDIVINAVGIKGSTGIGETKVFDFYNDMLEFQHNLFKASLDNKVKKYAFISSICGYPFSKKKKYENFFWQGLPKQNDKIPGLVKRIGEIQIEAAFKQKNWKGGYILRPSNVFGPFDNFNPLTAQVIPSLINKFILASKKKNKIVKIWGNGENIRDFIYSEDVASLILAVLNRENLSNLPFNIGSGKGYSIKYLAETLKNIIDKNIKIEWQKNKPTGDKIRVLNTKLINTKIKNFKYHSLKSALIKTIKWYIKNNEI